LRIAEDALTGGFLGFVVSGGLGEASNVCDPNNRITHQAIC
jgi:hypothetical protein